jgi:hypothetical protein
MKPSRYDDDDVSSLGAVELLALGVGLWLGLLVCFIGVLCGNAWRWVRKAGR